MSSSWSPGVREFFTAGILACFLLLLVACGSDGTEEPPPPAPHDFVQWQLSGDLDLDSEGGYAQMELYSAGDQSQAILVLQVEGGSTLTMRSPRGLVHLQKTVYDVGESDGYWTAKLEMIDGTSQLNFRGASGFLNAAELAADRVSGDFQVSSAYEIDTQGQPVASGKEIRINGIFSAHITRTNP